MLSLAPMPDEKHQVDDTTIRPFPPKLPHLPCQDDPLPRRRSEDFFPPVEHHGLPGDELMPPGCALHTSPTHWSIGWSDLMMTMCMLFLVLYVQQTTQRDFLRESGGEVVAGSEIELRTPPETPWPIAPITPRISDRPGDLLQRVEPKIEERRQIDDLLLQRRPPVAEPPVPVQTAGGRSPAEAAAELEALRQTLRHALPTGMEALPRPLSPGPADAAATLDEIYALSRQALAEEARRQLAVVEQVSAETVRIILAADLLFPAGNVEPSDSARNALRRLGRVIRNTPYHIHVAGHSDSLPIRSAQFPSNWELSLTRAGRVARLLIEEMGLPSRQFVVSGHADNQPRQDNSDEVGRAANRRVEILISREPALPVPLPSTIEQSG